MYVAIPTVTVDATNGRAVSWFSQEVPVDAGDVVLVNAQGFSSSIIDLGIDRATSNLGLAVRIEVLNLNQYAEVAFIIQTSDDSQVWFNAATCEQGAATAPGEYFIRFFTKRRYFRLSWGGYVAPDNNSPVNYPAGNYSLVYITGAWCAYYQEAGQWTAGVVATNTSPWPSGSCSANGTSTTVITTSYVPVGSYLLFTSGANNAYRCLVTAISPAGSEYTLTVYNSGGLAPTSSGDQFVWYNQEVATGDGGAVGSPPRQSQATIEAYFAGFSQEFAHAGGPIGLVGYDFDYIFNENGNPPATWGLESENQIVFSWELWPVDN